ITPVSTQTTISQPDEPTSRATPADTTKMPEPIIVPATSIVASNSPSFCWKPGDFSSLKVASLPDVARRGGLDAVAARRPVAAQFLAERAVILAVGEIDDQADEQPADQPQPVAAGQRHHEHEAEQDTQGRDDRHQRTPERAVGGGVRLPH